jgi:hypothetical protein
MCSGSGAERQYRLLLNDTKQVPLLLMVFGWNTLGECLFPLKQAKGFHMDSLKYLKESE